MSNLREVLSQSFQQQAQNLNFAAVGRIVSYDAGSQRASVQPSVPRLLSNGESEGMPVLEDVPVLWPRAGGASITFPVRAGDGCLIIFLDRSIDEWKTGKSEAPTDPRQHALSDAIAIMGLVDFNGGGGSGEAVEIKMGGTTITIDGSTANITAPSVTIDAPQVSMTGTLSVSGGVSAGGAMTIDGSLSVLGGSVEHQGVNIGSDHRHGGVESGGNRTDGPE